MILHVTRVEYISGHRLHLWFNDGTDGEVDLSGVLNGPVFEPLHDVNVFKRFRLEGHTVAWDNGADFAPEYLHELAHAESPAKPKANELHVWTGCTTDLWALWRPDGMARGSAMSRLRR